VASGSQTPTANRYGLCVRRSRHRPWRDQLDFATSVHNNFYFVIFTVPLQTALALWLAVLLNNRFLSAKGFFRTAFYFPSVTSSIAITVIFIFLFQGPGVVSSILSFFGLSIVALTVFVLIYIGPFVVTVSAPAWP